MMMVLSDDNILRICYRSLCIGSDEIFLFIHSLKCIYTFMDNPQFIKNVSSDRVLVH